MAHAEICPVCNGSGYTATLTAVPPPKSCHGCNGKGWVEVHDTVVQPDILGKFHILPNNEGATKAG
jgi:DnaJ-class molecular chaperone